MKFLPARSSLPPCSRRSRGFRGINGFLPTPGGKASVIPTQAASAPGAGPLHLFHDPLDRRCAWRCSDSVGTKGVPTPALRAGSTRLRRVEQRAGRRRKKGWRGVEFCESLPSTKNCGHHPRAAATMKHSKHEEGLFIRRVGDEVFAYRLKTQGPRG